MKLERLMAIAGALASMFDDDVTLETNVRKVGVADGDDPSHVLVEFEIERPTLHRAAPQRQQQEQESQHAAGEGPPPEMRP